jgi:hypothetical protein
MSFRKKSVLPKAKPGLLRIHELSVTYKARPSEILFPHIKNPHFMLAIDNIVFEMGHAEEIKRINDEKVAEIEWQVELVNAIIKAIVASRGL